MKISVIMGAYNVEKTVSRAISSIVSQTFKDWLFIICDDGSTDNTLAVLNQYKDKYPNKFLILKNDSNKGLTYTLNHCLQYVNTEYVARMDGDDISLPNRFQEEVSFLDANPEFAFVGCAVNRFDENGVWMHSSAVEKPTSKVFLKSSGFVHPTTMIRKAALDQVNGYRVCWHTNRCEDYDLWMRLYAAGFKGYNIQTPLFEYYEGRDSFSKRKYKYRIGEAVTRAKGYFHLHLYPKGFIYIFKPLISGLIPGSIIKRIHTNSK